MCVDLPVNAITVDVEIREFNSSVMQRSDEVAYCIDTPDDNTTSWAVLVNTLDRILAIERCMEHQSLLVVCVSHRSHFFRHRGQVRVRLSVLFA